MTDGVLGAAGGVTGGAAVSAADADVAMALTPSRAAAERTESMFDTVITIHLTLASLRPPGEDL
jgi:hypothetical protein